MPGGFSSGFSSGFDVGAGSFRFLADHYVDGEFIQAGETRRMDDTWIPSADVDPLDSVAVQLFYQQGPRIGGSIISRWTNSIVTAPVTYWHELSPNEWALTGLGANLTAFPPIYANIGRIE